MTTNRQSSEILQALTQFTCSETVYRHFLGINYTEGVQAMADLCKAYWLIDAIASWQPRCRKDPMLREMQFWTLKVSDGSAVLRCERDEGDEASRQTIEYSDFPLEEIKVWVSNGTMLLPSEH